MAKKKRGKIRTEFRKKHDQRRRRTDLTREYARDEEQLADDAQSERVSGKGSLMNLHGMAGPVESPRDLIHSDDRLKELVFFDLLERGYYMARRGFIALTMVVTDEELDGFVAALEDVLDHRRAVLPPRK